MGHRRPWRFANLTRLLHAPVGDHGTQAQIVADLDPVQPWHTHQVDERTWPDEATGDKDGGERPSGEDGRGIPQPSLERDRVLNGRRRMPIRLLHGPAPPRSLASPWAASRWRTPWPVDGGFAWLHDRSAPSPAPLRRGPQTPTSPRGVPSSPES